MTELQQIEKNILACALEIVDRLHLAYFLVCGSATMVLSHGMMTLT